MDQTAKVWDASNGQELLTLGGHSQIVSFVSFTPDGRSIATGDGSGTVRIWQAASPEQVTAWLAEEAAAEQRLRAQAETQFD
jgi:WD40 repeat protein